MQGFGTVANIHLIIVFVAAFQVVSRTDGITERAVKARGVFGRVGHDRGIDMPVAFERLTNRPNTTIHHVTWRNDICTRFGMA